MAKKTVQIEILLETADAADSISDIKKSIDDLDKAAKDLEVGEELDRVNDKSKELKDNLKGLGTELGKTGKDGKKGLKAISTGFKGVGVAIKAAGIGLVIGLFAALKEILEQQQPVLDLLDTTFTAISLTINAVSDAISEAFTTVSEANGGFTATQQVLSDLMTIALAPLELVFYTLKGAFLGLQLAWEESFFGDGDPETIARLKKDLVGVGEDIQEIATDVIDAGKSIGENIGKAIEEVGDLAGAVVDGISEVDGEAILSSSKRTTELKKQAAIAEAVNKGLLEAYDTQAEKQRQIRDDETLSIDDRKKANDELGSILIKQGELMQQNAIISVQAAQLAFDANKTTENEVALINAKNEQLAITATITGFQSEQKVNDIALDKEGIELNQTVIDGVAERSRVEKAYSVSKIEDDTLRLEAERDILEEEKITELDRLQSIIDNTNAGTQAQIDAKENLLNTELDYNLKIDESNQKLSDNDEARADKEIRILEAKKTAQLQFASAVGGALNGIAQLAKKGTAEAKVLALAEIAIGTGVAFIQGLNIAQKTAAEVPGGAFAFPIFFATQVGAILSTAAKAKGILASAPGGGGGGGGSISAPQVPNTPTLKGDGNSIGINPSPTLNNATFSSGASNEETIGETGTNNNQPQTVRAVVLESDISSTQDTLQNYQEQSEIG